jgi:molybdate transport system substrate-binding protein
VSRPVGRIRPTACAVAGALLFAGCSAGSDADTVQLFAASSLTEVSQNLVEAFGATPAGQDVSFEVVVAGSSSLVTQVVEGAPADVIATANLDSMHNLESQLDEPIDIEVFATNSIVIAVPSGNPLGIATLADLARPDVLVSTCAPQVPCGALTRRVVIAAGAELEATGFEPHVRAVRTRIELGEVDAGLIYVTDITTQLEAIAIPTGDDLVNRYPIAALGDDPAATAFVAFVLSDQGQAILSAADFGDAP